MPDDATPDMGMRIMMMMMIMMDHYHLGPLNVCRYKENTIRYMTMKESNSLVGYKQGITTTISKWKKGIGGIVVVVHYYRCYYYHYHFYYH